MGKSVAAAVLDAALSYISSNADRICVCSTEPTTYAEAITTYKLAISSTPTFQSPAPGDVSGRKLTVDEEADMTVDATGDAQHVALCKSGTSALLYVTTCTLQTLTSGNTVTVPAWDIEIRDPS
jgi:hypothetical protein